MAKKSENTGKIQEKVAMPGRVLDDKGRQVFAPGVSGNPAGKPPGAKHLSTKLFEALMKKHPNDPQGRTYAELLTERVLNDAISKGNTNMVNLIYDRVEGKPDQGIKLDVSNETNVSEENVMEIAKRISSELKQNKTG